MTPLEEQFAILRSEWPEALLERIADGSHLITIPNLPLPAGWSKTVIDLKFVAPVGYPFSRPDCFWTDPDLRLANGATPQNTGANPIPHVGTPQLWFSWHVATWNPNSDNLLTYLRVVERRLHDLR
jgi:Prokaryotic E2 family E